MWGEQDIYLLAYVAVRARVTRQWQNISLDRRFAGVFWVGACISHNRMWLCSMCRVFSPRGAFWAPSPSGKAVMCRAFVPKFASFKMSPRVRRKAWADKESDAAMRSSSRWPTGRKSVVVASLRAFYGGRCGRAVRAMPSLALRRWGTGRFVRLCGVGWVGTGLGFGWWASLRNLKLGV